MTDLQLRDVRHDGHDAANDSLTSNAVAGFLKHVASRLRWRWLLATLTQFGPYVLAAGLALSLLGWRFAVIKNPLIYILAVLLVLTAGAFIRSRTIRITQAMAALVADTQLETHDLFSTSLELHDRNDLLSTRVREHALAESKKHTAKAAVPIQAPWRKLVGMAAVLAATVAFGLANGPARREFAEQAENRQQIKAVADKLKEDAKQLRGAGNPSPGEKAAADELDRVAEKISDLKDLDKALAELDQAEAALQANLPQNLLAEKAASRGLERSLERRPLSETSSGDSASEQLQDAAKTLDGLSAEKREQLADRLDEIAAGQEAANSELAQEAKKAADALRNGDTGAAADALNAAGQAQADANAQVAAGEASESASASINSGSSSLRDAQQAGKQSEGQQGQQGTGQQGTGQQGTGQQGTGQQGTGQQGTGQQGTGQQGQQGQGQGGGGGASGNIAAGASDGGAKGGKGGKANIVGGGQQQAQGGPKRDNGSIDGATGDDVVVAASGEGDSENVGKANAPSKSGVARVPLQEALPDYERRAAEAVSRGDVSPQQREVVQDYFDQLTDPSARQNSRGAKPATKPTTPTSSPST